MKQIKLIRIIAAFLVFVSMQVSGCVCADALKADASEKSVYVVGKNDFFPIEYYNSETGSFEGILPDILKKVSKETRIDIIYRSSESNATNAFGRISDAHIISGHVAGNNQPYMADFVEVFSYEKGGKSECIGFAFTELADKKVVQEIKDAVASISDAEIKGIMLKYTYRENGVMWIEWLICLLGVGFVVVIVLLCIKLTNVQRKNKVYQITDAESGIGNLAYFKQRFENSIDANIRSSYYLAYIVVDSGYLRTYHGSTTFSEVLKHIVDVLKENRKDGEIIARITENGFAFAYRSEDDENATARITFITDKLNEIINGEKNADKCVFRTAFYHLNPRDKNSEILLFNLRRNCNKILQTDTPVVFCDVHAMNSVQEEKRAIEEITSALDKNEFKIYLQFIVDKDTAQIASAEALSRWENPEYGVLGPGRYIDIMEISGLISRHDLYIFELVCQQLEKWHDTNYSSISISCNFTRITISEEDFAEKIKEISDKYNFNKSMLAIEITEDSIEKDLDMALDNISKCKEMGFSVAIDDFGSGYTSLSNLCDYPVDAVKIYRDILLKTKSPKGKELFQGIVAFCRNLNLQVVCEGVETEEQNEFVKLLDCGYIQGWYYAKAIPVDECENFINDYNKKLESESL